MTARPLESGLIERCLRSCHHGLRSCHHGLIPCHHGLDLFPLHGGGILALPAGPLPTDSVFVLHRIIDWFTLSLRNPPGIAASLIKVLEPPVCRMDLCPVGLGLDGKVLILQVLVIATSLTVAETYPRMIRGCDWVHNALGAVDMPNNFSRQLHRVSKVLQSKEETHTTVVRGGLLIARGLPLPLHEEPPLLHVRIETGFDIGDPTLRESLDR